MLGQQVHHINQNDRQQLAGRLGISISKFDRLIESSNHAYEVIKELGPFYGREDVKEPTFRIAAEPVKLPKGSRELLTDLGNDILLLAKALQHLPKEWKDMLGEGLDYRIPPTWRVDIILDEKGNFKLNEIEGQDGANALMMAEQLAYKLQTLRKTTAAKIISTLKAMSIPQKKDYYKIAYLRVNNPHNSNAERYIKFIDILSKGTVHLEHIFDEDLREGKVTPKWDEYAAVISETSLSPEELYNFGIKKEQLLLAGNYNAIVNKGIFALISEPALQDFWHKHIGAQCLERLQKIFIPSSFVRTQKELEQARKDNKIVKASWAGTNTFIINRSRGIALPVETDEHGTEDRWATMKQLHQDGVKVIAQDFIIPAKISAFLRKKATNLETVEWYNRVCVKYVCEGNPNASETPNVALTATEVTLGPEVIPAGRKCAFTAGKLMALLLSTNFLYNLPL